MFHFTALNCSNPHGYEYAVFILHFNLSYGIQSEKSEHYFMQILKQIFPLYFENTEQKVMEI